MEKTQCLQQVATLICWLKPECWLTPGANMWKRQKRPKKLPVLLQQYLPSTVASLDDLKLPKERPFSRRKD